MKRKKTFTIMAILIAVLVLGVGYAAISNVTLTVNGNATIIADADFNVVFDTPAHTPTCTNGSTASFTVNGTTYDACTAEYTSTAVATMNVFFNSDHTSATACYKIHNTSTVLAASVTATPTQIEGADSSHFGEITTGLYTDSGCSTAFSGNLAANGYAYLKVTVPKANTTPVNDIENAGFSVTLNATPVQG